MTREEAIKIFNTVLLFGKCDCPKEEIEECLKMAIQALDQEPRKDEVILTKKEYGELVSSEFDNGYTKGYTEALEQNDVLDKIRAEIEEKYGNYDICEWFEDYDYEETDISEYRSVGDVSDILAIIDKYKAEGSGKE